MNPVAMHAALARGLVVAAIAVSLAGCARGPASTPEASIDETPDTTATFAPAAPVAESEPDIADPRELPRAFSPADSLASLRERFGSANLVQQDIPGPEGMVRKGVVLFPDDPMRRATIYFADEQHMQGVAMVQVTDTQSTWDLGGGVRMGTTLAELVARNGAPIEFSGFGWDYGGAVAGFSGGKLEPQHAGWPRTSFRLAPRTGLPEDIKMPSGDTTFSSEDYGAVANDIIVGELTLAFPRSEQQ